ncbi:cytochrome c oxidase assembly protein [Arthrobacter sp. JZ12]|nr:cytochrome c oxidase assembly protein [Arthrobacter sp. JZ12]
MDHLNHGAASSGPLSWPASDVVILVVLTAAASGYGMALWVARERGRWPVHRALFWYLGLMAAGAGLVGPVAEAAHSSFTAHMTGHLLLGMIAPVLLVLAGPITVGLRALPVPAAKALARMLRSPLVRVAAHPVTALVLNGGGLWALYATDLYPLMHASPVIHALVHAHILLAGYVFAASLVGVDPNPHPTSMRLRSAVLIVFIAVHSILAKWLYANPPAGVEEADARIGAQLMYYGGDAVDVMLIVLLFAGWYSATWRRHSTDGVKPVRGLRRGARSASPRRPDADGKEPADPGYRWSRQES